MPQKLKNIVQKKGSVLIFTLVIMFTIIVIALGIASVTSIEKKNTLTSNKSVTAFQVADSGSEVFMMAIKNADTSQPLSSLGCSGSNSSITGNTAGGTYEITFEKEDGTRAICSDTLADVSRIKSVGTYQQTTRAVDVAMAAGTGGLVGGCQINTIISPASVTIRQNWGSGCLATGTTPATTHCVSASASGYTCGHSGVYVDPSFNQYRYCFCIKSVDDGSGGLVGGCQINDPELSGRRIRNNWGSGCLAEATTPATAHCVSASAPGYTCGTSGTYIDTSGNAYRYCACIKS